MKTLVIPSSMQRCARATVGVALGLMLGSLALGQVADHWGAICMDLADAIAWLLATLTFSRGTSLVVAAILLCVTATCTCSVFVERTAVRASLGAHIHRVTRRRWRTVAASGVAECAAFMTMVADAAAHHDAVFATATWGTFFLVTLLATLALAVAQVVLVASAVNWNDPRLD